MSSRWPHILTNNDIWAQGFGDGDHRPADHDELVAFIRRLLEGLRILAIHYTGLPDGPLFVGTTASPNPTPAPNGSRSAAPSSTPPSGA
jgi:hypothetical protein